MDLSTARLRRARADARRRLRSVQRAAMLGGLSLAALGATATPASAPALAPPERPAPRSLPNLTLAPGDVRPATAAERAALAALPQAAATPAFAAAATDPFGLADVGWYCAPSVADLDGDGDLDVLAGEFYGTFRYFENTAGPGAAPAFASAVTNPFGLADVGQYSKPSVVDLDGDGDLDVLAGELLGTFRYFENTAGPGVTPAFAAAVTDPFGLAYVGGHSTPSVADLDGDGDLDVLTGESDGRFLYFQNTAGPGAPPAFASAVTDSFGLADVGVRSTPSVVDLDGDGDLDVIAGANAGTFSYFENSAGPGATPAFGAAVTDPFGLADVGRDNTLSAADLDGDGDLDVLAGELYGEFFYFENTTLPGAVSGRAPAFSAAVTDPFGLTDVGNASTPAMGDLDGDGDLDVLVGEYDGRFRYFENTAGGGKAPAFLAPVVDPFGLGDVGRQSTPVLVDLDGDGDLDVLSGAYNASFHYFENTAPAGGTPAFAALVSNPFGLPGVGVFVRPAVGDLDGDGDLDVLAGERFGQFRYIENTAGAGAVPAFAASVTDPFGLADVGDYNAPSVADLDGDGDLDVLAGEQLGTFRYFENTAGPGAAPAFLAAVTDPFGLAGGGPLNNPALGDLDGDGDLDVLAGDLFGSLRSFENTQAPPLGEGVGTRPAFAAAVFNGFGLSSPGPGMNEPSAGDLDGDGDLDVLWGEGWGQPTSGNFLYSENTAAPGATPAFAIAVSNPFGLVDIGVRSAPELVDLDGDGDLDVLAGEFQGNFFYFENTAGAGATPAFAPAVTNPFGLADAGWDSRPSVVDFDGDGDLDVMAGESYGNFRYFENTAGAGATPAFSALVTNPFGLADLGVTQPPVVGGGGYFNSPSVKDLDGDGDLDILSGERRGGYFFFENTAAPGASPIFGAGAYNPFGLVDTGGASDPAVADLDGDGDLDLLIGNGRFIENTAGAFPLAVQLTGTEGWRFLGSPNPSATLAELLDDPLWIQGATTGGDTPSGTPNVYRWNETLQDYDTVTDFSEAVGTEGVVMYVFSDDNGTAVGGDAGFPKVLDVPDPAPVAAGSRATFDVAAGNLPLSFTDDANPGTTLDGFNLIAAPSASWFSWAGVDLTDMNATVYVYDPNASSYRTFTQVVGEGTPGIEGGVVGPFQSMYVQAQAATASLGITPAVTNGGPFSGRTASPTVIGLSLRSDTAADASTLPAALEGGTTLAFGIDGAVDGYGSEDAVALASPTSPALSAWTEAAGPEGSVVALAVDIRPDPTGVVEVPVVITAAGALPGEPLVLSWPRFDGIPDAWSVRLVDRATGAEVDLRAETVYRFTAADGDVSGAEGRADPLVPRPLAVPTRPATARSDGSRFALVVTPAGAVATEDGTLVDGVSLVRPNPTSGRAEVVVTLAQAGPLRAAVYDALGREVAVLHDGPASGELRFGIEAGRLATGVYVVRVTGATLTESRTLTVVR